MKKITVNVIFLILISNYVYAEARHEFTGKIGTGYSSVPKKFGLDVAANYMYAFDPYFAAGGEVNFFWITWDQVLGEEVVGLTTREVKAKTDAYTIPFIFDAQLRLPEIFSKIKLIPSLTVGLGYSLMILSYSQPDFTDVNSGKHYEKSDKKDFYGGFSWHAYASIAFQPENSKIFFTLDLGYRGAYLERENKEIDLSGFIAKAGVKFLID